MNFDITRAMDALGARRPVYTNSESYYMGSHREVFANARWSYLFRENGTYVFNYCKTIVDTVLDRLEIASVQATTAAANKALDEMFQENELAIDATEIHRRALVYGECYAIVWPDEDGDVTITYNSPMTTVMIYDEENPRVKKCAAKLWEQRDAFNAKTCYMNLYYPDRIEKYKRVGELSLVAGTGDAAGWGSPYEIVENPFGEIPVFHFRTHRPYGTPEHSAAIGPQDAINKLVNNHMLTVDYQGAPQRYALSSGGNNAELTDFDEGEATRENLEALKSGPGELWYLNGVTQVGQFNPAPPATFTAPIADYVNAMASITSTPLHYFKPGTVFGSGEALRSAEAPLTKKVRDRQLSFGQTWRELFRFALKIEGFKVDVQVKWQSSESVDTTDAWNVASIKRGLGIPLNIVLEEMGYDKEIAQQIADEVKKEAEEAAKAGEQTPGQPSEGAPGQLASGMNAHNIAVHMAAMKEKPAVADPSKDN
jgi:hypothetical protein